MYRRFRMISAIPVPIVGNVVLPQQWTLFVIIQIGFNLFTMVQTIVTGGKTASDLGYSKFAKGDSTKKMQIDSRKGMILLYTPALIVALGWTYFHWQQATTTEMAVYCMLVFHYFKRVMEVLFLHKYSGTMDLAEAAGIISVSYSVNTLTICTWTADVPDDLVNPNILLPAVILFFAGQTINFYHHFLLASLRTGTIKKYVVPQGGLFRFVSSPHFLGELMSWLGVALASQALFTWTVLGFMTSYLCGRAYATTDWYHSKFDNYPKERRHIFPGLF